MNTSSSISSQVKNLKAKDFAKGKKSIYTFELNYQKTEAAESVRSPQKSNIPDNKTIITIGRKLDEDEDYDYKEFTFRSNAEIK